MCTRAPRDFGGFAGLIRGDHGDKPVEECGVRCEGAYAEVSVRLRASLGYTLWMGKLDEIMLASIAVYFPGIDSEAADCDVSICAAVGEMASAHILPQLAKQSPTSAWDLDVSISTMQSCPSMMYV